MKRLGLILFTVLLLPPCACGTQKETVVTITKDNFLDYYEPVYRENQLRKDASGKITGVWASQQVFDYYLKDEFSSRIDP